MNAGGQGPGERPWVGVWQVEDRYERRWEDGILSPQAGPRLESKSLFPLHFKVGWVSRVG